MMKWEIGIRKWEFGSWKDKTEENEVGSRTRRRPMGRDYAAAKDAEVGKIGQKTDGGIRKPAIKNYR